MKQLKRLSLARTAMTLLLVMLTTATAWAVDITLNSAVIINSSNQGTYNNKSIGGTIPSSSRVGGYASFYSPAGIIIDGIELFLTIDGLNMDYSEQYSQISGIALRNGATLHLTVSGTNTLKAGFGGAGIAVPDGCTLEITSASTGTLNAIGGKSYGGGAGIGSIGNGQSSVGGNDDLITPQGLGDIIINGGTINAQGASWYNGYTAYGGAAGIGSSEISGASIPSASYNDNRYINNITGSVTINGGTVNATGGKRAAGIGGGLDGTLKTITITGGTVTASAIGCGDNGINKNFGTLTCPNISLTGGTVTANGNIGYGVVSNISQTVGGSVTIGSDVTLKCTGSIKPFEAHTVPSNSYVDADGELQQAQNVSSAWGKEELTEGWWVVDKYIEASNRLIVSGTVNLIINDGATLKATKGIQVYKGSTLNIYAQMNGTGKIVATGSSECAGIGGGYVGDRLLISQWDGSCGTINIYGGTIEATGGTNGAGIGCGSIYQETTDGGTINIYGGSVKATGGQGGAGIGSGKIFKADNFTNLHTVNISGGTVEATGMSNAAGIGGGYRAPGGNITITGGHVTANSNSQQAKGIGQGGLCNQGATINLSWTNMTDAIYANSYGGSITWTKPFVLQGSTTEATAGNIGGQTIVPSVTVSFNANGGSETMNNVSVAYNGEYTLPECTFTPADGMAFDKWQVGEVEVEVGGKITVTADTEVIALWKNGPRTATFNLNGHGETTPDAQTVDYGAKLTNPAALTAEGWTFGGWYKESTCEYRWEFASETLTENRTLYAKWTENAHTISYILDGGVNSANNPLSYTTTETFSLTEPTKTGYTFAGWTYDGQTTPTKNVTINGGTSNMTFTATWTVNQYTITFNTDGAGTVEPVTYDYGAAVSAPSEVPTCHERIFLKWQNLPSTMPAENITVNAEWKWLYHYEPREATCADEGWYDCYYGDGHYYTQNPDGVTYTEVSESSVIKPKTGHDYDNPEWTWYIDNYTGEWSAKVKLTCKKDHKHVIDTFADEVTSEVTTAPTETTEGVRTYTAKITVDKESFNNIADPEPTFTDTYEVAIPKTAKIAMIGETSYPSVKAAMDAAASDDIITVMVDVDEPETACGGSPSYSKAFTLDLNGHSVTLASITMSASLTVKNGTLRCIINNQDTGNEEALTLDHADVYCEEVSKYNILNELVPYNGLDWYAKNIAVTNGSMLYIVGRTNLGGGAEDGFNLTIDGSSCVVLQEATLGGYNDARVRSQFAQYLPTGYSINTDYEDNIPDGRVMYGGSEYTDPVTLSPATITLVDNADNSTAIAFNYGYEKNVQLSGRTLTKAGAWNTLVLPFSLTAAQIATSPLAGATIKEMDNSASGSNLDGEGLLTLKFNTVTAIEAGKPYIVKWDGASGTVSDPVFSDVTITSTTPTAVKSSDGNVTFVGQYSPFAIDDSNINTVIMLGSGSTLGYSKHTRTLHSCRAHFEVPETVNVREFVLDFGDETTGIILGTDFTDSTAKNGVWYSLDGRKLDGKPTKKGMYIVNGRKAIVK